MALSQQHSADRAIASFLTFLPPDSGFQQRICMIALGTLGMLATCSTTHHQVLAQDQVLTTLPPPPSVTFGQTPLPVVPVEPIPAIANPMPAPLETGERYLVYVNGSSSLLLSQVQSVEPKALYREFDGRTVIQAGVFSNETNAREQIARLEAQGIGANMEEMEIAASPTTTAMPGIVPVSSPSASMQVPVLPAEPALREIEFGQQPEVQTPGLAPVAVEELQQEAIVARSESPARYFVVIPGERDQLQKMSEQVSWLVLNPPENGVQYLDNSRGPHVRVGPFRDRDTAENWEDYFRSFGMDARVHFQR